MNNTDTLRAWHPAHSDAEEEWTPAQRAGVLASILASPQAAPASQHLTASRRRSWLAPTLTGVGAALATAATVVALAAAPHHAAKTTEAGSPTASHTATAASRPKIDLAGYQIALPEDYTAGKVDTACTADLHLSANDTKRLITTPAPGCPLLITAVVRSLPADATPIPPHQLGPTARFTGWTSAKTGDFYIPAKLADGSTVYVTIDQGTQPISVAQQSRLYVQLSELAAGVQVTPAS